MSDTSKSVIFVVALLIGLPLLILWLRDRISRAAWRLRNPPENLAVERRTYEERILRPDWEFFERHLQRPAPPALRELYANRTLITAQCLDYSDSDGFSTFEALDEQQLIDAGSWMGFDIVAIATTDSGDPIYLRPGKSESDRVYITHHDGGNTEVFAESVAAMIEKIRHANRDT